MSDDSEKKIKFQIARIFGAYYEIYNPQFGRVLAKLRGNLRIQSKKERHPFVVGDFVYSIKKSEVWMIESREVRKSFLIRKSENGDMQALCANADYAMILVSLKNPETKMGFVDRFLASVSVSEMQPLIVFTKKDLLEEPNEAPIVKLYSELGYKTFVISACDLESISPLREFIKGKTCFIAGNSGVGKSTLVNAFLGGEVQSINTVSKATNKGRHTTTNSSAFFLADGTVIIDSPGIKEWGILHLEPIDILLSMPELNQAMENCNNHSCCSMDENCEMILAIENIAEERRLSLEHMLTSLQKPFRTTRRDLWMRSKKIYL